MKTLLFTINELQAGRRLGRIILTDFKVSKSQYAQLKKNQGVLLDGKPAHADVRVTQGQKAMLMLPENEIVKHDKLAMIVYEDEDLIIIDKPAPLATMRSRRLSDDTVEKLFTDYLGQFRPINRLDKGTSGLMAVAKSAYAQNIFQKKLHTDEFIREYIAVIDRAPYADNGLIRYPIGMDGEGAVKRAVSESGKPCATYYHLSEIKQSGRALVRLRLITGRTHQIRVHMAQIGCPVTGDYLYGTAHALLPERFALHSTKILLYHPILNRVVDVESPPPKVFSKL